MLLTILTYWPLAAVIVSAGLCRIVHLAKAADQAGVTP
jgi:hypothetical protein